MTPLSWEHWIERFKERGYNVLAPTWPGMDFPIEELRSNPSTMNGVGVGDIANSYADVITKLDKPPIIMGHSFGALITQILIGRGMGAAGVALDSAPPKGIKLLPVSSLKSALPGVKNPLSRNKTNTLTPEQFHYAFTNTMTEEESEKVRERYAVPGSNRALFQGATANFTPHAATTVDVNNSHRAPLLLITGELDHVAPPALVKKILKMYRRSTSVTEYKEFPGRTHFIVGQDGWEEVADYALNWAEEHTRVN
jgi:pimeloyl-ACP methyl ester carboxylesterase